MESDSSLVSKGPCPDASDCGSSDAYAIYDDGHGHCFSCQRTDPHAAEPTSNPTPRKQAEGLIKRVEYRELSKRGISEETCRRYGYGVADHEGRAVQVAPYCSPTGEVVAQKVRTPDKDFFVLGSLKGSLLFGQHLFRHGGKFVVVTEGEIDALSVAFAMGNKWPAVSIPNGASGAAKAIKSQLEWLASHDHIVVWFDSDEPGRAATTECVKLLPPGKVKIVHGTGDCKDANEVLLKHGAQRVAQLVWDAPLYRPDGIVSGEDISLDDLMGLPEAGWETTLPGVNELTRGIHEGELWLLTAGSGIGKSTTSREWLYKAICDGLPCGAVFLEENKTTTAKALIALDHNVPLYQLRENPQLLTSEQWAASRKKLIANGRYFAYDHFGSVDSDNLLSKLEYLAVSCGCKLIFLDHISIAVSGLDMDEGERRAIDVLMTRLRSLVERTRCSIVAVSHLRKVGGGDKGFEEGAEINLDSLRGSGSLKQLSDTVLAIERNSKDGENHSRARVLKCRYSGRTGPAGFISYNPDTGRQTPTTEEPTFEDEEQEAKPSDF